MATDLCPLKSQCALHRSLGMKAALQVWESFYCDACFGRCERYKLGQSGQVPPERLLPNGRLLDDAAGAGTAKPKAERAA